MTFISAVDWPPATASVEMIQPNPDLALIFPSSKSLMRPAPELAAAGALLAGGGALSAGLVGAFSCAAGFGEAGFCARGAAAATVLTIRISATAKTKKRLATRCKCNLGKPGVIVIS
jgi:hypothetical protein